EAVRRVVDGLRIIDLGADDGMRAYQHALSALDAKLFIPHRDFEGDIALLPLRSGGGEGTIDRHRADGDEVSVARQHQRFDAAYEFWRFLGHHRADLELRGNRIRH